MNFESLGLDSRGLSESLGRVVNLLHDQLIGCKITENNKFRVDLLITRVVIGSLVNILGCYSIIRYHFGSLWITS